MFQNHLLLIAPVGIEMWIWLFFIRQVHILLIAPVGIEISRHRLIAGILQTSFNRTSRN